MKLMNFEFFKKSLKIPYKILEVGNEESFIFFEIGGEVFYVSSKAS